MPLGVPTLLERVGSLLGSGAGADVVERLAERVLGGVRRRTRAALRGSRRGPVAARCEHSREHERARGDERLPVLHVSPQRPAVSPATVPSPPGVRTTAARRSKSASRGPQHPGQHVEVLRARHLRDPQRRQVGGLPLRVEQAVATVVEQAHQAHQRDLRGVGLVVEHRLAGEQAADGHAVQPAHEPTVAPGLDRVHPAELVEPEVRLADLAVDPARRPARVGAGVDHLGERGVDPDLEPAGRPGQRVGDVEVARPHHAAAYRAEPRHRRPPSSSDRHREDARAVRRQQSPRLEVGAGGDEVVVVVEARGRRELPDARGRVDRHASTVGA